VSALDQLLSNVYLNELDHHMARSGYAMTRYADDLVIQCRTREEAERAMALVQAWTAQAGLTLHPTKTKIVDAQTEGFDFLGYRFIRQRRYVRPKSLAKFRETIRAKTRRKQGRSLNMIIGVGIVLLDGNRLSIRLFGVLQTPLPTPNDYKIVAIDGLARIQGDRPPDVIGGPVQVAAVSPNKPQEMPRPSVVRMLAENLVIDLGRLLCLSCLMGLQVASKSHRSTAAHGPWTQAVARYSPMHPRKKRGRG
jgi:hypothetical protein